jgi:glycosyltransferase 2 family protein
MIYLLSKQGWAEIWESIQSIPWAYFVIALVLMLISRLTVVGRWHALLRGADQKISIRDTLRLVFAGLFATNFLPTTIGGDVIRLAGAVKRKLDPPVVTASLLADRLIGVIGMTTLLPVGLPYLLAVHGTGLIREPLSAMAAVGFRDRVSSWFTKSRNFAASTFVALAIWLKRPSALLKALLWTYGHQVALFTAIWVLFMGMHQTISWWAVAGLWIFNYYITLLPVSINGLGVQELSIAYIYTQFGGVSSDSALVMAVIIRLLYMLASLPGALALPEILSTGVSANSEKSGS